MAPAARQDDVTGSSGSGSSGGGGGVWSQARATLAGGGGGAASLAIGHPFDTIKVRCQTDSGVGGRGVNGVARFRGPMHCLGDTVHKEGLTALYRGVASPLIGKSVTVGD
jgi:solute carrier family 25 carnitine/acylcarnitine transporter 20/29